MTQARSWMETLTYAIRLLITFLVVVPLYLAAVLVGTVAQQRGLRIVVFANRFALGLLNITVSVESENPPEKELSGCVFVLLNQTSLLDGTLGSVSVPLPFRAVTNIEYAMIPIVGWAITLFAYVVVRQWPAHARRTLARIQRFLHEGGNVYISIEGRRSIDGALCSYKKGPAVLAIQTGSPIVPVYFDGARRCMPYGSWRIFPGHVRVRFLPAIDTQGLGYDDRDRIVAQLKALAEREMVRLGNGG